jgi:hypothetical protein
MDLLARLVEDRPCTLAGIAEDCHGTYCVYCGARGYEDKLQPDHRKDCPVEQGQRLLERIYGDRDEEPEETTPVRNVQEIRVRFPG